MDVLYYHTVITLSAIHLNIQVPEAELRSIAGCNLPDKAESTLEENLKASGYSVWTFPKCNKAVITEFPNRSFVSCIIAPGIVYPALLKYFEVRKVSVLHVYTCIKGTCS